MALELRSADMQTPTADMLALFELTPTRKGFPYFTACECLDACGGWQKGGFPKGWFWRTFPQNENQNEGTFGCSLGTKAGTIYVHMFPQNENRNEGTFAKTTLLTKPPFCIPVKTLTAVMVL